MTIQNQTPTTKRSHPACAACKHQRRRCAPFCTLAPYFPANRQTEFQNVHRLFGIGNVVNLLKTVPENIRDDAMSSVIYEANMRVARPVGGCRSVVGDLMRQIARCQAELQIVKKSIAFQRARLQQTLTYYDIGGNSVDDQMPFFENQEYRYRNQEFDKIGLGQQFLNDKPS